MKTEEIMSFMSKCPPNQCYLSYTPWEKNITERFKRAIKTLNKEGFTVYLNMTSEKYLPPTVYPAHSKASESIRN